MISFNSIPGNIRVPLAYVEFDNTRAVAGTPAMPYKVLFVGQKVSAGTAAVNTLYRVATADAAIALFGPGAMLARMIQMYKSINRSCDVWAIALADAVAGVAATGTCLFSGTATAAGTFAIYIGGDRVRFAVPSGMTASQAATALAAAVTADTTLAVTATADTATVTFTARHKGVCGNDIDLRFNYYSDDATPAGLAATLSQVGSVVAGSGNPDMADAITAMGDNWFQGMVTPYTDSANMAALEAELLDRWGGVRQIGGLAYCSYRATHANSVTFGDGRNSPLVCCMPSGQNPNPTWIWAAATAAQATASVALDPARPFQSLPLTGLMPPPETSRWMLDELNLLLNDGMSTWEVDAGGVIRINRLITMYQENTYGLPDASYLNINTPCTIEYLRYSLRTRVTQKFPRHKLADDGVDYGPGQAIATPKTIKAEIVALASEWVEAGLVENLDQFREELVVERNASDRDRVDVLVPPDLVNQFMIFAAQIQFRL
ncbi:MAG: phage tail protein [Desulfobacterium sp.]|nr:phage tail protein [Desulfobacteraceae bacterium]MBA3036774.1 phage tail protein [Desulfobacterium sp.]